ncbi:acetolactate synthase 1 catalytic subunit, partial [Streptomyces rubellomurinus subsp. indigoferus]
CIRRTNQELVTCALNGIPIKVAVINNGSLGMRRECQTLFYNQRYSNTALHAGTGASRIPGFVKRSHGVGCVGLGCERAEDLDAVIEQAMAMDDRPVVIDFIVHQEAMGWPMVAAGTSNDEI